MSRDFGGLGGTFRGPQLAEKTGRMKLRLLTLCTLLVGGAAFAQTNTVLPRLAIVRVDDPNLDTYTFGASACNDTITVRWSNTLTFTLANQCGQNPLKLWASAGSSCPETPGTSDLRFTDVPSLTVDSIRQGQFSVKLSELPEFKAASATDAGTALPCGSATPFTTPHVICGSVEYALPSGIGCANTTKMTATPLKLVYDTLAPTQPSISDYTAQDGAVRVGFSVDSDTSTVIIEVKGPTDPDWFEKGETTAAATYIRAEGLTNNTIYDVRIRAKDAAGNISEPSALVQVTPIRTVGFWGFYKDAGGTDGGGCSTGLGLAPLLFVAFAFRRSRRQG